MKIPIKTYEKSKLICKKCGKPKIGRDTGRCWGRFGWCGACCLKEGWN